MKIAVSSMGNNIDSSIDPRFGRAQWFLIVDSETNEHLAVANASAELNQGAGIQTAQMLKNHDVSVVITGHIGPNAFTALSSANISMFEAPAVSIMAAVGMYLNDDLKPILFAGSARNSAGMGMNNGAQVETGQQMARGMGGCRGGRGMGRGGGRGMGNGMGQNRGNGGGRGAGRGAGRQR